MAARGPALRAGVALIEQVYRGETSYLVKDPTTRNLLIEIMAVEEEHADDMRDLLPK